MKKRNRAASDLVVRALEHLCQDVQRGIIRIPNPDVLTFALTSLFPTETLIPQGSRFALHSARHVIWSIEEAGSIMRSNEDPTWLKRRLSRYM